MSALGCGREKWCAQTRRVLRMKTFAAAACFGTLAVTALGMAGETAAAPSGFANFGNAPKTLSTPCRQRATTFKSMGLRSSRCQVARFLVLRD